MPIDFAFAQARAQARLADRLTPSRWRAIESSTDLGRYVLGLRGTALAPVIQHFTASASPHAVERALRLHWRQEVESASQWVPRSWRDSVAWTAWLPDLDAVAFLLEGGAVLPWMPDDDVLGRFALEDIEQRREVIESVLGSLPPADEFIPGRWWYDRWLSYLPAPALDGTGLGELARLLRSFGNSRWAPASPSTAAEDSLELLDQAIARILHRHAATPAAVYCHLAMTAIELVRLRGGLVRRSLVNASRIGSSP